MSMGANIMSHFFLFDHIFEAVELKIVMSEIPSSPSQLLEVLRDRLLILLRRMLEVAAGLRMPDDLQ